ncbi:hypothetical protein B0H13DRAFT_1889165 [Mycena leptocephala]|nr:hypothetical protein B0H13DRAFT_1889165 [Mycena leptocephala]
MASPTTAAQILERLLSHDSLKNNLQFVHIQRFFELVRRIWLEITPPQQSRPLMLPSHIADFLASVLNLDTALIQLTWNAFADLIEMSYHDSSQPSVDDVFRIHALPYKIGLAQPLGEESAVEARLYTLRRGVLPVFSKSLYCRSLLNGTACNTRYYNNYFVQNASKEDSRRQYYSAELPALIHVTETSYVEQDLCKYFRVQMALSHNTCQGISRVYNQALGNSELPNSSRLSHELTGELVLEAFILHALLQDQRKHGDILSLPHRAYQEHRFDQAMADRNLRMAGDGQDMWLMLAIVV